MPASLPCPDFLLCEKNPLDRREAWKASFGQRRKMIRNSLRSVFGNFGGAEHPFFTQRAEQLSVADFVELTDWVAANRT